MSRSSRNDHRSRLANRAAALAMVAALLAMIGTVAVATAFEHSRSAAVRAAATAPLAAAAGAMLWARSTRAQLRRAGAEEECGAEVPAPACAVAGVEASDIADERRASTDLLAIDEVVRAFHRTRTGMEGRRPAGALGHPFASDGRLDLQDGGGRHYAERSRTVHVIGDFAVVISAYEVDRPAGRARGVVFLQLRLEPEGWRVHDAVARNVGRVVTERFADRRPTAALREKTSLEPLT